MECTILPIVSIGCDNATLTLCDTSTCANELPNSTLHGRYSAPVRTAAIPTNSSLRRTVITAEGRNSTATALSTGVLKIMSKMGVSTIMSYRGAQLFEAVGLSKEVIWSKTTSAIITNPFRGRYVPHDIRHPAKRGSSPSPTPLKTIQAMRHPASSSSPCMKAKLETRPHPHRTTLKHK